MAQCSYLMCGTLLVLVCLATTHVDAGVIFVLCSIHACLCTCIYTYVYLYIIYIRIHVYIYICFALSYRYF